jgi:hypothetical protein
VNRPISAGIPFNPSSAGQHLAAVSVSARKVFDHLELLRDRLAHAVLDSVDRTRRRAAIGVVLDCETPAMPISEGP